MQKAFLNLFQWAPNMYLSMLFNLVLATSNTQVFEHRQKLVKLSLLERCHFKSERKRVDVLLHSGHLNVAIFVKEASAFTAGISVTEERSNFLVCLFTSKSM